MLHSRSSNKQCESLKHSRAQTTKGQQQQLRLRIFSGGTWCWNRLIQRCPFLQRDCLQTKRKQKCGLRVFLRLSASFHTFTDYSSKEAARKIQLKCLKMHLPCPALSRVLSLDWAPLFGSAILCTQTAFKQGANGTEKNILSIFCGRTWC